MADSEVIVLFVLIGAMIMLFLAFVVIIFVIQHRKKYLTQENELLKVKNEKEQEILKAIITTQEEERSRIGSNLHDSVGADLSMVKMNLSRIFQDKSREFTLELFNVEMGHLESAIATIRTVVLDLYPKALHIYGFIKAFEGFVNRLNDTQAIESTFSSELDEPQLFLDFRTKVDLYRVCLEVLNNLIKHSKAKVLTVDMSLYNNEGIKIIFQHNGIEFLNADAEKMILQNNGIGLKSIKNRINLIKGKINYIRERDNSVIEIFVPFDHE